MYLAPACAAWLLAGSACLEWRAMWDEGAFGMMAARPGAFTAAACMGFGVNSLAYGVIQLAGALTLKVIGTVKNALVVGAGVGLYGDAVSPLQGGGYALSLVGFGWYNHLKMKGVGNAGGGGGGKSGEGGGPLLPVVAAAGARERERGGPDER